MMLAGAAALALVVAGAAWVARERAIAPVPLPGARTAADVARDARPIVAIRPFEALGDDPNVALLARGMTADLVTDLSRAGGLSVIVDPPWREVAGRDDSAAPPIRYVVTGSVQRVAGRVRLQVHLVDDATGEQLWSERYDRPLSELFAIQEALGPQILRTLPAQVSAAQLRTAARRYTTNLEAYEDFQRAQAALLVRESADNATARDWFRRAIALDPAFARAYAGLALTYAADYRNRWTARAYHFLGDDAQARINAQQALSRNPASLEAHVYMAAICVAAGDRACANWEAEEIRALRPGFAARAWLDTYPMTDAAQAAKPVQELGNLAF